MLNRKLIKEACGNYGCETYAVMPRHKLWVLGELLSEMNEFYKSVGANGGGSFLKLFRYDQEWERPSSKPICEFKFAQGRSGLLESEFTQDHNLMRTEVFCDIGYGFWGCDTWYAYLADLPEVDNSNNTLVIKETQMACFTDKCFVVLHYDLNVSDGFDSCKTIDNVYYSLNHALQDCKDRNLVVKEMTDAVVDFETISDGNIETHYYIIKTNLF